MSRPRVDRFILIVSDEATRKEELSIDMPTYFKVDTSALYDSVMKEMIKQEKRAKKEGRG